MNPLSPPADEPLTTEAAAWVARLHADDTSEGDWLALEDWLSLSEAHRSAYHKAEMLWSTVEDHRAEIAARLDATPAPGNLIDLSVRRKGPRGLALWAFVGSHLAALAIVGVLIFQPAFMIPTKSFATAPGERKEVVLSDGTRISMNGASTLSARVRGKTRQVKMQQAEAYFDVIHDPNRPFVIEVGESRVRVLGTAFDIRRDGNSTRVAVTRGIVEVSDLDGASAPVRLVAGQVFDRSDASGHVVVTANADDPAGWRTGRLIYHDETLGRIATDLSRVFKTPITVRGDIQNLRFSGVLDLDREDAVIARLEAFLPVSADRTGGRIELRRR